MFGSQISCAIPSTGWPVAKGWYLIDIGCYHDATAQLLQDFVVIQLVCSKQVFKFILEVFIISYALGCFYAVLRRKCGYTSNILFLTINILLVLLLDAIIETTNSTFLVFKALISLGAHHYPCPMNLVQVLQSTAGGGTIWWDVMVFWIVAFNATQLFLDIHYVECLRRVRSQGMKEVHFSICHHVSTTLSSKSLSCSWQQIALQVGDIEVIL